MTSSNTTYILTTITDQHGSSIYRIDTNSGVFVFAATSHDLALDHLELLESQQEEFCS